MTDEGSASDMHYEKMYAVLFNAITDALEEMDALNFGSAGQILRNAQQKTEDLYCDAEEQEGEEP